MKIGEGTIVGRYEIRSKIGAGGMGEVYRAEDRVLLRAVAIKFINIQRYSSAEAGERFLREARAASAINHPNIVTIHEINETDEHAFIVMEYVEGRSLRERIREHSLDAAAMLDAATQVADALMEAHRRGILHRDIKPENVLINERGQAKLLDFGLARALELEPTPVDEQAPTQAIVESLTGAGSIVGTVPYMSPEQLRKEPLDNRSDIFSFGIMLHEMLTGTHPFWAGNAFEIAALILGREAVKVAPLETGLPPDAARLLERLLEKDRRRRCASFAEVKRELEGVRRQLAEPDLAKALAATQSMKAPSTKRKPRAGRKPPRSAKSAPAGQAKQGEDFSAPHEQPSRSPALTQQYAAMHGSALSAQSLFRAAPKTILVLPLEAVGSPEEGSFIGIGLASLITTDLAKIEGLSVLSKAAGAGRANQTGQGARELARELGANLLLEGEVMRARVSIRITARLIDVESGHVIWGNQYRGEESDLFNIQDAVCESVAEALKVNISDEVRVRMAQPPTFNLDAFELYSQGRASLERRDVTGNIDFAIQLFEEALKLDPRFALAQAGLGEAFWMKYEATGENVWVSRALAASDHALVLDPHQAQVRVSLGIVYHGTGKIQSAVEEFERAIELQPLNDNAYRWLGRCYMQLDETDKAKECFKKAVGIRPGYWDNHNWLGTYYYTCGRYQKAAEQYRRVITIQPDNYQGYNNLGGMYYLLGRFEDAATMHKRAMEIQPAAIAYANLGTDYFYLGRYEEAIEAYNSAIELDPSSDLLYRNLGDAYLHIGRERDAEAQFEHAIALLHEHLLVKPNDPELIQRLAICHAKLHREQEALACVERAATIKPHNTALMYQKAVVYALIGHTDKALEFLRLALERGYSRSEAERDPDLSSLRERAEYRALFPAASSHWSQ
jgi:serine/threonine protein kinase/tetratricopeptide (TPR) repeat protein